MQYICVTATRDEIREPSFATKWFADLCFTENDRIYRTTELSLQYYILDILCVRDTFSEAVRPKVIGEISDHLAITFSVDIPIKAPCNFRQFNTRKIHRININDFREDIGQVYSVTSTLIPCATFLTGTPQLIGKKYHCTLTKAS